MHYFEYILRLHMRQRAYNKFMPAAPKFDPVRLFQALGNPTRLRLLNLMGRQEICVCEFVRVLDQPQPMISQHLASLRAAGLVEARREGKWMHYRLAEPPCAEAASLLTQTLEWMSKDKKMLADRARLGKTSPLASQLIDCKTLSQRRP
jgi:ArsR family transcriptional regulator